MGWVKDALAALEHGEPARVRPHGGSMRGRIESGQLVTIVRTTIADVAVDEVVFVGWRGNYLLHLVVEREPDRVLIGNNVGKTNGWVDAGDILGRVVDVTA